MLPERSDYHLQLRAMAKQCKNLEVLELVSSGYEEIFEDTEALVHVIEDLPKLNSMVIHFTKSVSHLFKKYKDILRFPSDHSTNEFWSLPLGEDDQPTTSISVDEEQDFPEMSAYENGEFDLSADDAE